MQNQGISIDIGPSIEMDVSQTVSVIGEPIYDGPYDVTPAVDGLTLATRQKSMSNDVTIEPIPIVSASNESGGRTVTIG